MSFFPQTRNRLVPGVGSKQSKIAIVGDFTSAFDDKDLVPFSGHTATVLESCLHAARLIRAEVYITNTFKQKTQFAGKLANTDFFVESNNKRSFTELGRQHVEMLIDELAEVNANVIVAAGNPALMALTDKKSVAKYRGYVVASTVFDRPRKVIPIFSFGSAMRNYIQRHVIVHDLKKARVESDSPTINRPERKLLYNFDTVEEILQWIEFLKGLPEISFDIEVVNYEIPCLSLGDPSGYVSVVVPIGNSIYHPNGWTELEELQLWRAVQRLLGNPKIDKVCQNGIFDIHFLLTKYGIEVRGKIIDTMIGHSVMFPDLPKGLDFLGSLYCGSQEYWKDSVSFNNIKGDS